MNLFQKFPETEPNVFVAPSASVVGRVQILDSSSVWYGAVVRGAFHARAVGRAASAVCQRSGLTRAVAGDFNDVHIGAYTSVGTGAVIQSTPAADGHPATMRVGDHVTIGPGAVLQGCTIENDVAIGAGAVVMEGALVEAGAIVSAGAVVHPDQRVPAGQVWSGNPARFERALTPEEVASTEGNAESHATMAKEHAEMFTEVGTGYRKLDDRAELLAELESGELFVEKKPEPQL